MSCQSGGGRLLLRVDHDGRGARVCCDERGDGADGGAENDYVHRGSFLDAFGVSAAEARAGVR